MIDQATELRKLVLRAMRNGPTHCGPAPRLALVTSGRVRVGVTSLAVNLSVALAELGLRVVLVDADMEGGEAAGLCGLPRHAAYVDLNIARRDIHEVLQRGPAGIQVVPGLRVDAGERELRPWAIEKLMRQFAKLGQHADQVVVDAGSGDNDLVRRLAQSVDDIAVVTTPDDASVADAYRHIKRTLSGHLDKLWLIVNMADDDEQARDVHLRLCRSCERFLGRAIASLGQVPQDDAVRHAAQRAAPFVVMQSGSAASRAVQRIAADWTARPSRRAAA